MFVHRVCSLLCIETSLSLPPMSLRKPPQRTAKEKFDTVAFRRDLLIPLHVPYMHVLTHTLLMNARTLYAWTICTCILYAWTHACRCWKRYLTGGMFLPTITVLDNAVAVSFRAKFLDIRQCSCSEFCAKFWYIRHCSYREFSRHVLYYVHAYMHV